MYALFRHRSFNDDIASDVDLFNTSNAAGGVNGRYRLGGSDLNHSVRSSLLSQLVRDGSSLNALAP